MSASMRPTRWPRRERAMARLTATVVLPTPPLPEPTATIFETPGSATGAGIFGAWAIFFTAPFGNAADQEIFSLERVDDQAHSCLDRLDWCPVSKARPGAPITQRGVQLKSYRKRGSAFSAGVSSGSTSMPTTCARTEWIWRTPSVNAAGPDCKMRLDRIS